MTPAQIRVLVFLRRMYDAHDAQQQPGAIYRACRVGPRTLAVLERKEWIWLWPEGWAITARGLAALMVAT